MAEKTDSSIPVDLEEVIVLKNSQPDSSILHSTDSHDQNQTRSVTSTTKIKSQSAPEKKLNGSAASNTDAADVKKGKKCGIFMFLVLFESTAFAGVMVLLIASLGADSLQDSVFWGLRIWKWCLLMFAVLCGRLIAHLCTKLMMFFIWRFWVHERVLYFAYGVRKSVMFFIWVGLVTLAWGLMANRGVHRSKNTSDTVNDVTRGIAGCLIGAFLWLMKTLLVKLVGCIHAEKLLDKIKEAICTRKLLLALSKMEKTNYDDGSEMHNGKDYDPSETTEEFFHVFTSSENIAKDKFSRDTIRELMNAIRGKRLLSLPHGDEKNDNGDDMKPDEAARETAADIIPRLKPGANRCISLENLLHYVKDKKMIDQLKGLAETVPEHDKIETENEPSETENENNNKHISTKDKKIKESVFTEWLVEVYREHDSLNSTLKHSKTAIDELNVIASVIVLFIIIIMWLLFMRFLSTKLLLFLSSQLLLVVFMFGNSVKTAFEAVIFVFLVHAYDVGDRCIVDGVQMIVDEMNILTTTFLRYDNEKIYYPNAVLASKPISNLYRSPPMNEIVEFAISLHTPEKSIRDLEESIKGYLEKNPRYWRSDHSLQFREIEDVNKMKVALLVNHTVNFHYIAKRMRRRSELVLELKNIFERLKIEYRLLPQQVDISSVRWSGSVVPHLLPR